MSAHSVDRSRSRRRRLAVGAAALSLTLLAGACGDDDDTESTTGAETGATSTTAGGGAQVEGDVASFCEAYVGLSAMAGGPPPSLPEDAQRMADLAEQAQANAPEEIAEDVATLLGFLAQQGGAPSEGGDAEMDHDDDMTTDTTMADMSGFAGAAEGESTEDDGAGAEGIEPVAEAEPGTEGIEPVAGAEGEAGAEEGGGAPPPEFLQASAAVGLFAAEECADESLTVVAKDYEFEGMPTEVDAGEYGLMLDNQGTEWHEIIVMRKNDGVTASAQELLAMPEEEAMTMASQVGAAFAAPGKTSGTVVDLTPGDYVAVCFIPVGTTGLDVEGEGPPHFMEGMVAEFTVS